MYNETLEALLEDIDDPTQFKRSLLENQLRYHFANKTKENNDIINDSVVMVRRIIDKLTINECIGIQTLDLKNPKVISSAIPYDASPVTRPLSARWTVEAMEDIKNANGIDIHSELMLAISTEVVHEITAEIINKIDQVASYAGVITKDYCNYGTDPTREYIKDMIISNIKDADGNWIIVSPFVVAMLQNCKDSKFKPDNPEIRKWGFDGPLSYMGMLDKTIKVYSYAYFKEEIVLIGSKVEGREDTPIVYAPETLLIPVKRHIPNSVHDHRTIWAFMTRYSLFVEPVAADVIYRKISIKM